MNKSLLSALAVLLVPLLVFESTARAGGFFVMDRGVRSAGRGSAFVAGVDDPSAMFMNPAGLAFSGRQVLFDAALPLMRADYTRVDGGGTTLPNVQLSQAPLPIPTFAYSDNFGMRKLTFGIGVWAPNAALSRWPSAVNGGPAPQRYSLINMDGTLLVNAALGIAYQPVPQLSIGATAGVVTGSFGATTTMSACDGTICTQPENPEYDVLTQFNLPMFVAPAASFGAIFHQGILRIGTSFDLPYNIRGNADLRTRLPSAPLFQGASVSGPNGSAPTAQVNVPMPWFFRAGVEVRPTDALRVETSFVVEGWRRQRSIDLTPNDVAIRDLTAIGNYQVGPVSIPRQMRNTYSLRVGAEYTMGAATLRAGVQLETSAFAPEYLSALTLDSKKVILSGGIGVRVTRGVYLDGVFSFSSMQNVTVTNSRVPQPNPIRPTSANPAYVGNGAYHMNAFLIGGGVRINLDERRATPTQAPPTP